MAKNTRKKNLEADSTDVKTFASVNKPNANAIKNLSKLTVACAIAVCIVVVLAAGSIAIALVTHFNANATHREETLQSQPKVMKRQEGQLNDMTMETQDVHTQVSTLTQDLRVTRSQLNELMVDRYDMENQLAKLTEDLDASQSQLMIAENMTRGTPGKTTVRPARLPI